MHYSHRGASGEASSSSFVLRFPSPVTAAGTVKTGGGDRSCPRVPRLSRLWALAGLGVCALTSHQAVLAMEVVSASPQGLVNQAENVALRFREPVSQLGDPQLPDPATLQCQSGIVAKGQGRWTSEREWVFSFSQPLPAGARCEVRLREDFKPTVPQAQSQWQGTTRFAFQIAAPKVMRVLPWTGSAIEESQRFLLQLNGAADRASMAQRMWCESQGVGERIPVQVFGDAERDALLKAMRSEYAVRSSKGGAWVLVGCQRPLPANADMALVWGPGIAAQADPATLTQGAQRFRFKVRAPLTAEFSCERERANAPCLPIRPLRLSFSEPVPRELALQAQLRAADGKAIAAQAPKSADEGSDKAPALQMVEFPTPLAEQAEFQLSLPKEVRDVSGRPLSNAASFPLRVRTGMAPPLAKFAAAPFGIIEWERGGPSLVPLSLRRVQPELQPGRSELKVKRVQNEAELLQWYARMQKADEREWTSRKESLLARESGLQTLAVPELQAAKGEAVGALEVVGVPIAQPGYHVLELRSRQLGKALLDPAQPMYVRTGVLVTNLGLHFKLGRENSLVWVTSLDKGRPVEGATVAVHDCHGKRLWEGRSNAQGLATIAQALREPGWDERCPADQGLFVTARHQSSGQPEDMAFMFSSWRRGIENWRFNVPTSQEAEPDARAHTVTDRPLLRVGEKLSMKHFFRLESLQGLSDAPPDKLPDLLHIVHTGTGEDVAQLPLKWQGGRYALSEWLVPKGAKLGQYRLEMERAGGGGRRFGSGSFRVEEFRVPLVDARLQPPQQQPMLAGREQIWTGQLNFMAGGPMAQAPLQLSAMLRPRWTQFAGYEDFAFEPPSKAGAREGEEDEGAADGESDGPGGNRLLLDKQALKTDAQGGWRFKLPVPAQLDRPTELRVEMSYRDPDGQTHTRGASQTVWPSELVLGLRAPSWAAHGSKLRLSALALDTQGRPLSGREVVISARQLQTLSTRKRLVGGFYAYEHQRELKPLGELCRGSSDAQGLVHCEVELKSSGQVELLVSGADSAGRKTQAARSIWVTRAGELWFEQDNDDRIDVLPERRNLKPGETARLQVRMPYRDAQALITVEREGVMHSELRRLSGRDPWIELKIDKDWAPNAYVSVLVLRGRLREVPWYSFFSWGWREPVNWWREWRASDDYQPPTAMVDLAKPSYKLGMAALQIGTDKHRLKVEVLPAQAQYGVRQTAQVKLRVTQDGQPVPDALVAFAAVDEGLLALAPNPSWQLLDAMLQTRPWGVQTATAQSEIVGRRHYGRKAVAAGGGGGASVRELFDTLLSWQPAVRVDARGEATVQVPLNDSLTRFRLVAVADAPGQRFGNGDAVLRVSQDLQLLSGLPPQVREGDTLQAMLTVRNASERAMELQVGLQGEAAGLADGVKPPVLIPAAEARQTVKLAAGQSRELQWRYTVPQGITQISWTAQASEQGGAKPASDAMKVQQQVQPAVPLRVMQASLRQLDGPLSLPVAAPADGLADQGVKRGGLQIGLQPRLSTALPGIRRYFQTYPYSCLEQQGSKALALHDRAAWSALMAQLPGYQDGDGLFAYFPLGNNSEARGSEVLTAYLLSAAHEAGEAVPEPARGKALDALAAFVEGRIQRRRWSPRDDESPRRIAALAALARYERATPRLLSIVDAAQLSQWPTATVIDWLQLHQRMANAPQREARIAAAQQQLRSRLSFAGTTLRFVDEEQDAWWWLMDSSDGNAARLILALLDDPSWREDLPRMVTGALARQQQGAWYNTTANFWGTMALEKFSARFESQPVAGRSTAALKAGASASLDWGKQAQGGSLSLPWPAAASELSLRHEGSGKPWATVQALAAVPLRAPLDSGYRIKRSVQAVSQQHAGRWSRGDVMRVRLEIEAAADMSWVALSDPLPTGAMVLAGTLDNEGERREGSAWMAFQEHGASAWRGYWDYLPKGRHVVEYTLRLNNAGRFQMPVTRAEAMYAPDRFGELPNAALEVGP